MNFLLKTFSMMIFHYYLGILSSLSLKMDLSSRNVLNTMHSNERIVFLEIFVLSKILTFFEFTLPVIYIF